MRVLVVVIVLAVHALNATADLHLTMRILLPNVKSIVDGVKHAANASLSTRAVAMLMQNFTTQMDQQM